jgi:hypothetical protein
MMARLLRCFRARVRRFDASVAMISGAWRLFCLWCTEFLDAGACFLHVTKHVSFSASRVGPSTHQVASSATRVERTEEHVFYTMSCI